MQPTFPPSLYSQELLVAQAVINPFGEYSIHSSTMLYNVNGEVEAICFSFNPTGYVILNVHDWSIPEYSPTATSPFNAALGSSTRFVYNGPLQYYTQTSNTTLFNIREETTVPISSFTSLYAQTDISNSDKSAKLSIASNNMASARASLSYMTRHVPVAWATDYYCGLDGCAIILKYIHDYHDTDLLNSSMNGSPALQQYLLNNGYLPNAGTSADKIVYGSPLLGYTGINDFFDDRSSSMWAYDEEYSDTVLSDMQESFSNDLPVLLGTDPDTDWNYGDHWVIAYGYFYQDLSGASLIINDGWGNTNIYVTTSADHYDNAIFFTNRLH